MSVVRILKIKYIFALAVFAALALPLVYRYGSARADEAGEQVGSVIKIVVGDDAFTYEDKYITPSDFTVGEEIERRKINAPIEQKRAYMDGCLSKGADYKTAVLGCYPLLERTVNDALNSVYVAPTQAEVKYDRSRNLFYFTREKAGQAADEARLYADIYCCLRFNGSGTVTAAIKAIQPTTTEQELRANFTLRSSYTTDYRASTESRSHNVSLALSKISGTVIEAGDTFSFNATVGARTEENGFKSAKIIVDGKYVDGVGGGVCQASTALYNAALTAGLECTANAHSICPSYCPPGLDAMISGASDLTITNNTGHPVYILASGNGGMGTVRVYGERTDVRIEPESVVIKTVPYGVREVVDYEHKYFQEDTPKGERVSVCPGKNGVSSETYLTYIVNGVVAERVRVRTNDYIAVEQVIAVSP